MWFNPIMKSLLYSPLHGLVSKNVMSITFTGRKSGQVFTVPVNYVPDGDGLLTVSLRGRTWWRNLRGGAPVTIRLQGRELKAIAEVIEDEYAVATNLMALLQGAPGYARYLQVKPGPDGQPDFTDVCRAAQGRVIVRTRPVVAVANN